jgi:hypothetical protein
MRVVGHPVLGEHLEVLLAQFTSPDVTDVPATRDDVSASACGDVTLGQRDFPVAEVLADVFLDSVDRARAGILSCREAREGG